MRCRPSPSVPGDIHRDMMPPMRLAILADIHGNVFALEAVLADLEQRRVDQIVNLGDCVSGPLWPRETAELLMRLDWPSIRGNHDRWVTDWPPEKHYPSDAFAFRALNSAQLAWLRALLPARDLGDGILACHGPQTLTMLICWRMSRAAGSCRHGARKWPSAPALSLRASCFARTAIFREQRPLAT
jgi:hypothetical protein